MMLCLAVKIVNKIFHVRGKSDSKHVASSRCVARKQQVSKRAKIFLRMKKKKPARIAGNAREDERVNYKARIKNPAALSQKASERIRADSALMICRIITNES